MFEIRWRKILMITAVLGIQGIFLVGYFLITVYQGNWCGRITPDGSQEIYFGEELCTKLYYGKESTTN